MHLKKLTTILIVDQIEPCLASWKALGYEITVRVPSLEAEGPAGFVILSAKSGELMLQTRASLADDLPVVAKLHPSHLLYADVASLTEAKKALGKATVLVKSRKTFYGATESWLHLEGGTVLGLSEHAR